MSARRKTPQEMNAQAAAFWADPVNARINAAIVEHERALAGVECLKQQRQQQLRARRKRPSRSSAWRNLTIKAMLRARRDGRTFQDFMDRAEDGINNLTIVPLARRPQRYRVEYIGMDQPSPKLALATLKGWWTQANPTHR